MSNAIINHTLRLKTTHSAAGTLLGQILSDFNNFGDIFPKDVGLK